ncbi:gfo/Idh/MocA family oxidoreductase [Streptomyces sp. NRRL B-1677]|uniref:Gfo/Idh/MocA family protein n=1 Tax=Streptomyces sp. NRRL B-1677 TaxID=2682966 RepID=UPI0018929CD0|nr:Gfo/Idh/MocA family oxidoreductase [Streptomyces sp. NRRL B-1677]MBF6046998.1 gfo/Idh/MocA family oxidoreductase [Streptomyces sp. NRRL B-1677]
MTSFSPPQGPIRVGVVGLSASGGWAAAAHVPALAGLDGYELRALSASSDESARAAGEKYAVPLTFSSAEELARSEEVDLVVVTVRVPQHLELIRPALEAGKTVFSEWPLATDLAQAEELADLAHRRGLLTAVGLQARSSPPLRYLRALIAEGYVGRVLSTSMLASGGYWGATYDDSHAYLLDVTSGATLLSIPFGHSVDALAMVLGEFREVSAHIENLRPQVTHVTSGAVAAKGAEDQIAVTGLLASGAVAAVHLRGGESRATAFHWEINGTDGDLVVKAYQAQWWSGRLRLYGARGNDRVLTELPVPAAYQRSLPQWTERSAEPAYNVAHEYALLRDRITGDLAPDTDGVPDFRHAVRRHRMLENIREAARTGRKVTLTQQGS